MTASEIAARLDARPNGAGWQARCPAHEDGRASLSISQGDDGRVLLHCHAGCVTDAVLRAAGLTFADLQNGNGQPATAKSKVIATYDYADEDGQLLYQSVRLEPKGFRQRRPDGKGGWIWNMRGVRRVVYHLDDVRLRLHDDTCKEHRRQHGLPDDVFVCEGEKDVDRVWRRGLIATTNVGGAGKWSDAYSQQLLDAGAKSIIVLADNDDAGRTHADGVARSCAAIGLPVKIIALPDLPEKGDVSDWMNARPKDDLQQLVEVVNRAAIYGTVPTVAAGTELRSGPDDDDRPRPTQATRIIDLALGAGVELWHTPTGDPHVTIPVGGHHEHHVLGGRSIREYLARLYHTHTTRTPGSQAIADALGTLSGMARYDGDTHEVHVRVAGQHGAVYLDLGAPTWRAVEITAAGWRIVAEPAVRFRRGRALLALPEPVAGGSLDALRDVIHVASDDDWRLLVAWTVGALRPSGPYPLLALDGEQGSGKSTTARMLRRLLDPSGAELRAEPREIRDLMIAASGGWVIALDNLSHVQPWLSDALCRVSTGGALSTRQLYTDGDEHIIEAVRPILLTGIASVITRGDLTDRAIAITLPTIPESRRRPEADLWTTYDAIRPQMLGALCDAVACALRREQDIHLDALPRMADWARWVTAAEPALGIADGAILQAYARGRQHAAEQTLDGDPVAVVVQALSRPWHGTAAELLALLTPAGRTPHEWPKTPRGLSGVLRRLAPDLRRIGIDVVFDKREAHTGRRHITIKDLGIRPSPSSPPSPSPDSLAFPGDGCDDRPSPTVTRPSPEITNRYRAGDDGDDGDGCAPTSPHIPEEEDDASYYGA